MRIDREAFLAAVAALGGCQQDRSQLQPPPAAVVHEARAAIATRDVPRVPEPVPVPVVVDPAPVPVPPPTPQRTDRKSPSLRWFIGLSTAHRDQVTEACQDRSWQQCRVSLHMIMPRPTGEQQAPEPEVDRGPVVVAGLPTARVDAYCKNDFTPPSCETPLVVAFDSQPVEFVPAATAQFAFVPGAPMATDWPSAATPWIALDLDGDGSITSGAELFGSSTVLPGGSRATNGFAALAALDANGDGVLDARDPMFAKLVLWSDRNGDHRSSPDELRPLASVVTQIPLAFTRDARCNERDDCEGERGTLHWRDAAGADHAGAVVDVYIPSK
jgi:hypothetical protein